MCQAKDDLAEGLRTGNGLAPMNWRKTYKSALDRIKELEKANDELVNRAASRIVFLPQPAKEANGNPPLDGQVFSQLVGAVVSATGVAAAEILGKSRNRKIVDARYILIGGLVEMGMPLVWVGRMVGRDHSTVIYARDVMPTLRLERKWRNQYAIVMESWAAIIEKYQDEKIGETA